MATEAEPGVMGLRGQETKDRQPPLEAGREAANGTSLPASKKEGVRLTLGACGPRSGVAGGHMFQAPPVWLWVPSVSGTKAVASV